MEVHQLIQWLEELYPNKLPTERVDDYVLGTLIGQRELIEQIKIKVQYVGTKEEEIK